MNLVCFSMQADVYFDQWSFADQSTLVQAFTFHMNVMRYLKWATIFIVNKLFEQRKSKGDFIAPPPLDQFEIVRVGLHSPFRTRIDRLTDWMTQYLANQILNKWNSHAESQHYVNNFLHHISRHFVWLHFWFLLFLAFVCFYLMCHFDQFCKSYINFSSFSHIFASFAIARAPCTHRQYTAPQDRNNQVVDVIEKKLRRNFEKCNSRTLFICLNQQ